jgi:glyoxylase-like metal-dependent hydrolase (beta-lactamase superfamily II)
MKQALATSLALAALLVPAAMGQSAATVVGNASKAMGIDGVTSVHYYGTAEIGNLGQNNNANQPWPLAAANDYDRSIDFATSASRATWMNYAVPVTGGPATLTPGQQNINAQSPGAQQLEIWITPWGFLKGAAAYKATMKPAMMGGKAYRAVTFETPFKSPGGVPYKITGYIGAGNLVDRVVTHVENPIFGDMLVETEYNYYRQGAAGLMFPAQIIQSRGGWPTFTAYILNAFANPANLQTLLTPPARPAGAGAGPGGPPAGGAPPPAGPPSEKLFDGVYRIGSGPGAYNAVAIEMADHIILFEPGGQGEARSQAIFAETRKVIPNKPIRYGVITHHHFDHTGGLQNAVAEGITIVTPVVNKNFLTKAFSAPRTLVGDALAKAGKKPVIEGFAGDKRVFTDATRTLELHVIQGLPHADGLVIGWLPKEKLLIYADMFNLPAPLNTVPNPPVVGTAVFVDNIERLGLQPDRIMSIHSLNPDRLTTLAEIKASLGRR